MGRVWLIGATALAALGAAACSTPIPQEAAASQTAPPLSYSQSVDDLIAATRTQDSFQSTTMREVKPCMFAFDIAPGRQSYLQFSFDVRQLNLDAISGAQGQVGQSAVSRRIACAEVHGACASYTGMPVPFVEIASPTLNDLERALGALRRLQTLCKMAPPAAG